MLSLKQTIRRAHENRRRDGGGWRSFDRVNDLDRLPSLLRYQWRLLVPLSDDRLFPKRDFFGASFADWTCIAFWRESFARYSQPRSRTICQVTDNEVPLYAG